MAKRQRAGKERADLQHRSHWRQNTTKHSSVEFGCRSFFPLSGSRTQCSWGMFNQIIISPFPSGKLFYSGPPSTTESRFNVSSFRDYKNKLLIAKFKLYSIPPLKSGQHRFLITQWNRSSSFSVSGKIHSFFFLNVRLQRVKGTRCSENRAVIHGMAVSYNPLKQCLYYKDTSRKEKRMSARVLFLPYIFKWLIFQDA